MATKKATKKATEKTSTKASGKVKASNQGKCTGWAAVEDRMPPGPPTLRVTGQCKFPTHGFKVTLKKAVPQGINPKILLLNKVVTPPSGIVIQTPEVVQVSYKQKVKAGQYTNVTILPDGKTLKVKIVF
jgi:hypothetical protein